ncbi:MAG: hypothetical protein NVS1B10_01560 [Candidatus Saccharimonadales bacterium]
MANKKHPIYRFIGLFIKNIDDNPNIQLKIHTYGFWYWTINFPIITYLFFFQQGAWLKYGLFITLIYSIYANWTSDYTGMSSSQSVINTSSINIDANNVTIKE